LFTYELKNYSTENKYFTIKKNIDNNTFEIVASKKLFEAQNNSFTTDFTTLSKLLQRKFGINISLRQSESKVVFNNQIFTQSKDSLLKIMMHRSDNFYAEQFLLMSSNQLLNLMNNDSIIKTIKNNDFVNMPQIPRWVDGSGLSRYNMITPESLVWLLVQMKDKFGINRLQNILATGGQGTISNLYKNLSGKIYAKTGTLSNHAALSGYLYTKSGKLLIFSTLTSGHQGSAQPTRKAVEKLLNNVYENY
jgi:serine-type D-Ala-D-Ala carboxypeptidase/endopeptidase (penicillin-binding protein 4)